MASPRPLTEPVFDLLLREGVPEAERDVILRMAQVVEHQRPMGEPEAVARLARMGLRLARGRPPGPDEIVQGIRAFVALARWIGGHPSAAEVRQMSRLGRASGFSAWLASRLAGPE